MGDSNPGFAEAALNIAGLASDKALLHVFSFGRIRVGIPPLLPGGKAPLVVRLPDARVTVHPTLAEAVGVVFWIAAFLTAAALYPMRI
jgi:hypothetical protein